MDPASAAVAFVGFSASLTTLAGLVINCSKTLYDLQRNLREAPKEMLQLQHDLRNFQALLIEIRCRVCENGGVSVQQSFRGLWESVSAQMEQDMESFLVTVSKHSTQLRTPVRKRIPIRIRYVFDEDTVEKFRRKISRHIESLSMVQAFIIERKLDTLVETNTKFIKETDASFQYIFARLRSFDRADRATDAFEQEVNNRIDAQLARGHRHLVVSTPRTHTVLKRRHHDETYRTATVYYKHKSYTFCVGQLSVQISKSRSTRTAVEIDQEFDKSFEIEFVPPWWMANTMLRCSVAARGRMGPVLSITPISINQNPSLLKALYRCDISHLKHLFTTYSARPTDMVLDPRFGYSVTLIEAVLRVLLFGIPCSLMLSKHKVLLQFLLDQGQLPSTQATILFFSQMRSDWAYDRPESLNDHVRFYTEKLLIQNGCTLESVSILQRVINRWPRYVKHDRREQRSILSTIVKSALGFEGIHDCLFRQSEPWLIEDLTMSDTWYIAVHAHTDPAFREVFRDYLHCYRSPVNTLEKVTSDHSLKSPFDIATTVDLVQSASMTERNDFLNTLIVKGSPPMLAPFLNAKLDPDEGGVWNNYLGNASACGNLSVIDMLIDCGADSVRAFPKFLLNRNLGASKFDSLYSKLLDSMTLPRKMMPGEFEHSSPINSMLKNDRAMEIRPDAPLKLLEHGQSERSLICGSPYIKPIESYVYNAIVYNRPAELAWFLDHGARPNDIIQDIFYTDHEDLQCLKRHSWLTLAVEVSRTTCLKVLLDSAADMFHAATSRDRAGRSAIDLARSFPSTRHPRISCLSSPLYNYGLEICAISVAQDASTLTLLEAAVGITSESPPNIGPGLADGVSQQHIVSMSHFFATLLTAILHSIDYILHIISTSTHTRLFDSIKDQFNQLWRMSPFEALLVRLSFLIAYCMLFCYKIITFTTTLTNFFERSDFRLFLKVCVVALICYSLEFGRPDGIA